MKNNQPLPQSEEHLFQDGSNLPNEQKLTKCRLAESLLNEISGGNRQSDFEFFARWNKALG